MLQPTMPANEAARIKAVQALDILDTMPEDAFDRITKMAARIMDVPIACVSVVDKNRQWFKSSVGLGVTETNRMVSFCGHAINSTETFMVSNAKNDPRFWDNPLVLESPNIAFYIGVPVMSPDGLPVGTLCAMHNTPKVATESQKALMQDLAYLVESELKLRQESTTDLLSGMLNRRHFYRIAENEVLRAQRGQHPFSLMMIDIDHFKRINDNYGHLVGDQVIRALGEILPATLQRPGDTIARLGGDEFIAVLADTDASGARFLGEKLRTAARESLARVLKTLDSPITDLSVSIGLGVFKPAQAHHERNIDELIALADQALYESKHQGRDRVTVKVAE